MPKETFYRKIAVWSRSSNDSALFEGEHLTAALQSYWDIKAPDYKQENEQQRCNRKRGGENKGIKQKKAGETRWGRKRLQRYEWVCLQHCREKEGGCTFSISTHHTDMEALKQAFTPKGSSLNSEAESLALTNMRRNHRWRCRRKKDLHKYRRMTICSHSEYKDSLNCLTMNLF